MCIDFLTDSMERKTKRLIEMSHAEQQEEEVRRTETENAAWLLTEFIIKTKYTDYKAHSIQSQTKRHYYQLY